MPTGDDPQRGRLYKAEQTVRERYKSVDLLPSSQAFAAAHSRVVRSEWWTEQIGRPSRVRMSPRMFRRAITNPSGEISIGTKGAASWSWSLLVLAHELAHVAHVLRPYEAGHSPKFVAWQIAVTHAIVGADAAEAIRLAYRSHGVSVAQAPDILIPDVPIIGFSGEVERPRVDPEFAARRVARLAKARDERKDRGRLSV